jgi:hypothetical protein
MKRTKSILSTCIVKIYALTHALTVLKYVDFLSLKYIKKSQLYEKNEIDSKYLYGQDICFNAFPDCPEIR